jgi:hypothetical protein
MTDLVHSLRTYVDPDDHDEDRDSIRDLMVAASNRIEHLTDALRKIATMPGYNVLSDARTVARKALE